MRYDRQPVTADRDRRGFPALLIAITVTIAVLAALIVGAAVAGRAAASERPGAPTFIYTMKPVPLDLGDAYTYKIKRAWQCGDLKAHLDGKPVVRSWVRHTIDPQGHDRYVLMPGKGPAATDPISRARCTDVFKVTVSIEQGGGGSHWHH